jgi:ABC-type phosphate/phosphonate transport system substrate-binding protein
MGHSIVTRTGAVRKDVIEKMRTLFNGLDAEERKAITDLICISHSLYVKNRLNELDDIRRYEEKEGT